MRGLRPFVSRMGSMLKKQQDEQIPTTVTGTPNSRFFFSLENEGLSPIEGMGPSIRKTLTFGSIEQFRD